MIISQKIKQHLIFMLCEKISCTYITIWCHQKIYLIRAAELVGLTVHQLMNDNTAVALNYGVFRRQEFNVTPQVLLLICMCCIELIVLNNNVLWLHKLSLIWGCTRCTRTETIMVFSIRELTIEYLSHVGWHTCLTCFVISLQLFQYVAMLINTVFTVADKKKFPFPFRFVSFARNGNACGKERKRLF